MPTYVSTHFWNADEYADIFRYRHICQHIKMLTYADICQHNVSTSGLWELLNLEALITLYTILFTLIFFYCNHESKKNPMWPIYGNWLCRRSPLPWVSVHWLVQCTLECHWLTQCTLGYHWVTQRILARYTGTPLEKLSWNSPHWNATGETLTFAAYTGTPLEGLWQPTQSPTYIVKHAE